MGDLRITIYISGSKEDRATLFEYIDTHLKDTTYETVNGISALLEVPPSANIFGARGYVEIVDCSNYKDLQIIIESDYPDIIYTLGALAYEFGCEIEYYIEDDSEQRYFSNAEPNNTNRYTHVEYTELYDDEVADILGDDYEFEEYGCFCRFKDDDEIDSYIRKQFKFQSYAEAEEWFRNNMENGGESNYFIRDIEFCPLNKKCRIYGSTIYYLRKWLPRVDCTVNLSQIRENIWNSPMNVVEALYQDLLQVKTTTQFKRLYLTHSL